MFRRSVMKWSCAWALLMMGGGCGPIEVTSICDPEQDLACDCPDGTLGTNRCLPSGDKTACVCAEVGSTSDVSAEIEVPDAANESSDSADGPDGAEVDGGSACEPGAGCDDGNLCTSDDRCLETGECVGEPLNCPSPGPCAVSSCDPLTGQCVDEGLGSCFQDSDCPTAGPCTEYTCTPDTCQCEATPIDHLAAQFEAEHCGLINGVFESAASGAMTFEVWLNPFTKQPARIIDGFSAGEGFQLGFGTSGKLVWQTAKGASITVEDWVPDTGKWFHVAAVVEPLAGTILYVNGEVAGEIPLGMLEIAESTVGLGCAFGDGIPADSLRYTGLMDDFRISTVARYSGPFNAPGPHAPDKDTLVLIDFDNGNNSELTDTSGNKLSGSWYGAKGQFTADVSYCKSQ